MGSSSSGMKDVPDAQELVQETGFSAAHLLRLHERFEFLDRDGTGELRPEDFDAIRELAMNPIGDRIIRAFFSAGKETLDFPSFVRILAHFRPADKNRDRAQQEPANSRTRKLRFAFQLYDQDGDGKISRAELLQVLRLMLEMQVTEEQLQCIAERAIQEADLDQDDAISFDEFKKSLEKVDIDHKMSIRFLK
ncbi:calcineurin B homologous protein 2 [Parambassis ranga]|uniref:Calcineurin B homologous protein 2 n=1 Tax=Parambassis ranga TaxID=210632 RepID=A0A6P7JFF7_9TELE|nr:calcineurin B homologous protein 2-like [Parambassis ranga]